MSYLKKRKINIKKIETVYIYGVGVYYGVYITLLLMFDTYTLLFVSFFFTKLQPLTTRDHLVSFLFIYLFSYNIYLFIYKSHHHVLILSPVRTTQPLINNILSFFHTISLYIFLLTKLMEESGENWPSNSDLIKCNFYSYQKKFLLKFIV